MIGVSVGASVGVVLALAAASDTRVVRVAPERWSSAQSDDVAAALARLPAHLRAFPGGPLELALVDDDSAFGMGDGDAHPEWNDGTHRRFHLYRYQEPTVPDERRALYRLEKLPRATRERVWRQRAVVHAVMQRWEDAQHLSDRHTFRSLNGWLAPFERPLTWSEEALNVYPWAYSRARGRASAALDLVTFAEEFFVPAESFDPHALADDDRVVCQELSKARFLREALHITEPRPHCPAFDRWARPETLDSFEMLLVAASGRSPESMFGHLMMRPVRKPGATVAGPSFQPIVQLVAFTGNDQPGPAYAFRGIFGGYNMALVTTSAGSIAHQMLENEQRTIRRFRLQFSARENMRALERVWELERRGYWSYRFFTDNCGTAAVHFLNSILEGDEKIELPPRIVPLLPTAALDAIARVRGRDGPLLVPVADAWVSGRELAGIALTHRDHTAQQIRNAIAPTLHAELDAAHERASSSSPQQRIDAYDALARIAALAPDAPWRAYFTDTLDIERYSVDRAYAEKMKVDIGALAGAPPLDAPEVEVAQRQRQFEREEPLQRAEAVFDRMASIQRYLDHAEKRPLTSDEQEVVAHAEASERSFLAAADIVAHLEGDGWAAIEENASARGAREQALLDLSLPRSGYARFEVQPGAMFIGSSVVPALRLSSSALQEDLGDHRVTGFQPSTEVHALTGTMRLVMDGNPLEGTLPRVDQSEFTLAGFRTLLTELPTEQRSVIDHLGWGLRLGHDFRAARALPHRAMMHAEALAILDVGSEFERFTALGVGAAGQTRFGDDVAAVLVGPRLSLAHRSHLFGGYANALRVEASYLPAIDISLTPRVLHEVNAELLFDFVVGPIRTGPRVKLEWEATHDAAHDAQRAAPTVITTIGIEWVG